MCLELSTTSLLTAYFVILQNERTETRHDLHTHVLKM